MDVHLEMALIKSTLHQVDGSEVALLISNGTNSGILLVHLDAAVIIPILLAAHCHWYTY
jgi:hypothetical protein